MKNITLPSRPNGPFSITVKPGPKSGPGERHVEVVLTDPKGATETVSARFKDAPSREHLFALQAKDGGALARDLEALQLIEANPITIRLDKAPALICIAKGELLAAVLKAKDFVGRPPQGATTSPPADAREEAAKPKRRSRSVE